MDVEAADHWKTGVELFARGEREQALPHFIDAADAHVSAGQALKAEACWQQIARLYGQTGGFFEELAKVAAADPKKAYFYWVAATAAYRADEPPDTALADAAKQRALELKALGHAPAPNQPWSAPRDAIGVIANRKHDPGLADLLW